MKVVLVFVAAFLFVAVSAQRRGDICARAQAEYEQIGSAAQRGQIIDNPDMSPEQNAREARRINDLLATVRRCNSRSSSSSRGGDICARAQAEYEQIGSAAQRGQIIDNPDMSPEENAREARRINDLLATVRRCGRPSTPQRAPRRPSYQPSSEECMRAFAQMQEMGSSARGGVTVDNPDASPAENARQARRNNEVLALVRRCQSGN